MQQTIGVELEIKIPEDSILISRIDFERLRDQELTGRYWSMKQLEERTGMGRQWLLKNILLVPRYKKTLEDFVFYPRSKGEHYSFNALKMSSFLDKHFKEIYMGSRK